MYVYECEDSLEGIFTAIYQTFEDRREHKDTLISINQEQYLFAEYHSVQADKEKTLKVMHTLQKRFGENDYGKICLALSSPEADKAQVVYQTIALGLAQKGPMQDHLFDMLANDYVNRAFSLSRAAGREEHLLQGFVRFEELDNGILYAKISPKHNVLTFLMPHFSERFPMENFMIYDAGRDFIGIHPRNKTWYLLSSTLLESQFNHLILSEEEVKYQELFRYFCHKIAIKDRENYKLQRNMLPLRFREYMVEFQ